MRIPSRYDFSIIIPSRERPHLLTKCIESFYKNAINPTYVETILILDYDDPTLPSIFSFLNSSPYNEHIRTIIRSRSKKIIRDYNNAGTQLSTAKYVWIINDDVEIKTEGYDNILIYSINRFLRHYPDRLLYVLINDDIHVHLEKEFGNYGCCFPIISKETADVICGVMPSEIDAWGADTELWRIFRGIKENRILDLTGKIQLKATTIHNDSLIEMDNTQDGMFRASKYRSLTDLQLNHYIELMNSRIDKSIYDSK